MKLLTKRWGWIAPAALVAGSLGGTVVAVGQTAAPAAPSPPRTFADRADAGGGAGAARA